MTTSSNCGHGVCHKTSGFCLCCGVPATAAEKRALSITSMSRVVPLELIELADHRAAMYGHRYAVVAYIQNQGESREFHVTPYENLNGRRPLYLTEEKTS